GKAGPRGIKEWSGGGGRVTSFDFSPPKSAEAERRLVEAIGKLEPLAPAFVSVTYGAGGSTREKTVELVGRIRREWSIEAMAHLTCVGATRSELEAGVGRLPDPGGGDVLPLRGGPPQGEAPFPPTARRVPSPHPATA